MKMGFEKTEVMCVGPIGKHKIRYKITLLSYTELYVLWNVMRIRSTGQN